MMDVWLTFAKTGNPSTAATGDWTPNDANKAQKLGSGPDAMHSSVEHDQEWGEYKAWADKVEAWLELCDAGNTVNL
jgi:carboxylesterase type B